MPGNVKTQGWEPEPESSQTRQTEAMESQLTSFKDLHASETLLVCGYGASLAELRDPKRFVTIGVNDVGRLFDPTYLVVLNPRRQFKDGRFRYVEESRARAVFTQLDLGLDHPRGEAGFTPLMFAVLAEDEESVELLVARQADLEATTDDGRSVQSFAVQGGNERIRRLLGQE